MRPIGTGRTAVSHLCSLVAHECSFRNNVGAIITLIRALLNVIQHAYRIAFYHATHVVEITHSAITFTKACLHVECRMMYACTPAESRSETIRANFVCLRAVQTSRRHSSCWGHGYGSKNWRATYTAIPNDVERRDKSHVSSLKAVPQAISVLERQALPYSDFVYWCPWHVVSNTSEWGEGKEFEKRAAKSQLVLHCGYSLIRPLDVMPRVINVVRHNSLSENDDHHQAWNKRGSRMTDLKDDAFTA